MEVASLFGSYQGDRAALFMIHTAHLQWRRGLEKVAQTHAVKKSTSKYADSVENFISFVFFAEMLI